MKKKEKERCCEAKINMREEEVAGFFKDSMIVMSPFQVCIHTQRDYVVAYSDNA